MQKIQFHKPPAGLLPSDSRINFFVKTNSDEVFFLTSGSVLPFKELQIIYKRQILKRFLNDSCAMQDLGKYGYTKALELYARCMFGSLDSKGNIDSAGNLLEPVNFMCSDFCYCLQWKSKSLSYEGKEFTLKQLSCLSFIAQGLTDLQIADKMQISVNSLSDIKRRLQKKLGTDAKTSTAVRAIYNRLVR